MRLTSRQRYALELLVAQEGYGYENGDGAIAGSGESALLDGQAFVNHTTATALERRGLVELRWIDFEGGDIYLTDAGRKAAMR